MRALCIARHRFLSEHYCAVFGGFGIESTPIVGIERGMAAARAQLPDVIFCDYDILASASLRAFREDHLLAEIPIIAISLTRRPGEIHLPVAEGVVNFLYLPLLTRETTAAAISSATPSLRVRPPGGVLRWNHDRLESPTPN